VDRFPINFTGANRAMALLGVRPHRCFVERSVDLGALPATRAWADQWMARLHDDPDSLRRRWEER